MHLDPFEGWGMEGRSEDRSSRVSWRRSGSLGQQHSQGYLPMAFRFPGTQHVPSPPWVGKSTLSSQGGLELAFLVPSDGRVLSSTWINSLALCFGRPKAKDLVNTGVTVGVAPSGC